jgi:hypothetical protein
MADLGRGSIAVSTATAEYTTAEIIEKGGAERRGRMTARCRPIATRKDNRHRSLRNALELPSLSEKGGPDPGDHLGGWGDRGLCLGKHDPSFTPIPW